MSFDSMSLPAEHEDGEHGHETCTAADRRLHERFPVDTPLQLRWEERKGVQRQVRGRAIDVSRFGLQVQAERAIPAGTVVNVYTAQFVPLGRASVRHCTIKGMDYNLGLYMPDLFVQDL
jgi:nitrous oxidase accessory protein NosD